ncbi:MAG: hypothetical protein ISR65_05700 [Bacteriovoracaceae bacterium]|nr:hypothetical protein [Bacteriovoracaceae bacterium]
MTTIRSILIVLLCTSLLHLQFNIPLLSLQFTFGVNSAYSTPNTDVGDSDPNKFTATGIPGLSDETQRQLNTAQDQSRSYKFQAKASDNTESYLSLVVLIGAAIVASVLYVHGKAKRDDSVLFIIGSLIFLGGELLAMKDFSEINFEMQHYDVSPDGTMNDAQAIALDNQIQLWEEVKKVAKRKKMLQMAAGATMGLAALTAMQMENDKDLVIANNEQAMQADHSALKQNTSCITSAASATQPAMLQNCRNVVINKIECPIDQEERVQIQKTSELEKDSMVTVSICENIAQVANQQKAQEQPQVESAVSVAQAQAVQAPPMAAAESAAGASMVMAYSGKCDKDLVEATKVRKELYKCAQKVGTNKAKLATQFKALGVNNISFKDVSGLKSSSVTSKDCAGDDFVKNILLLYKKAMAHTITLCGGETSEHDKKRLSLEGTRWRDLNNYVTNGSISGQALSKCRSGGGQNAYCTFYKHNEGITIADYKMRSIVSIARVMADTTGMDRKEAKGAMQDNVKDSFLFQDFQSCSGSVCQLDESIKNFTELILSNAYAVGEKDGIDSKTKFVLVALVIAASGFMADMLKDHLGQSKTRAIFFGVLAALALYCAILTNGQIVNAEGNLKKLRELRGNMDKVPDTGGVVFNFNKPDSFGYVEALVNSFLSPSLAEATDGPYVPCFGGVSKNGKCKKLRSLVKRNGNFKSIKNRRLKKMAHLMVKTADAFQGKNRYPRGIDSNLRKIAGEYDYIKGQATKLEKKNNKLKRRYSYLGLAPVDYQKERNKIKQVLLIGAAGIVKSKGMTPKEFLRKLYGGFDFSGKSYRKGIKRKSKLKIIKRGKRSFSTLGDDSMPEVMTSGDDDIDNDEINQSSHEGQESDVIYVSEDADIVKKEHVSIWKIISTRYLKKLLTLFGDKQDSKKVKK